MNRSAYQGKGLSHRPVEECATSSPALEVLSQSIDEDNEGSYRIRSGGIVRYVDIEANTFNEDIMCQPALLLPRLPSFPEGNWTRMKVYRDKKGSIKSELSWDRLAAVETVWHPNQVDVLSLPKVKRLRPRVLEVLYNRKQAICKIARFDWEISNMERETRAYARLDKCLGQNSTMIAPAFLGHVIENGRVMGILLEKVEGSFASIADFSACRNILRKLHSCGMIHGDINRYNFLVSRTDRRVRLVDFEHTEIYDDAIDAIAANELKTLKDELMEETGRGSVAICA